MSYTEEKRKFLEAVRVSSRADALGNSIRAALQHNPTYLDGDRNRVGFRNAFDKEIIDLAEVYGREVSHDNHIRAVSEISDKLSHNFGNILQGSCLRIGTVQKALNLYLKIVWCLENDRAIPPHCPVDRIVLRSAGIYENWTTLNSIDIYSDWIFRLRQHAFASGHTSLAEWELSTWNSATATDSSANTGNANQDVLSESKLATPQTVAISSEYIGCWTGYVYEKNYANPYRGEMDINTDGGHTRYNTRKPLHGSLAIRNVSDSRLEFDESITMGGVSGIIRVTLASRDEIKCTWHRYPNGSAYCQATMQRK